MLKPATPDDWGDPAPAPRTISRGTFHVATFGVLVLLMIVEGLILHEVCRAFGFNLRNSGGILGGLAFPNWILACFLVDRVCKALGLSRSGQVMEGRRPGLVLPAASGEESLEIRCAKSFGKGMALVCLGFVAIVFLVAEVIVPRKDQTGRVWLVACYAFCLGLAALTWWIGKQLIIRVDRGGVTSYVSRHAALLTTIPWSRIAARDLVIHRDTWGEIALARPVFKDSEGRDLFPGLLMCLPFASKEDQMRLLGHLKQRFPKLDHDPLEL